MRENLLLLTIVSTHILFSKYTKVEESFNLQAIHDFLHYGTSISQFDHNEFPGVVERSAIGAFFVVLASSPLIAINKILHFSKLNELLIVRFIIGTCFVLAFNTFSNAVKYKYGQTVARILILITCSQFHIVYYCSRTLPNTFALILTTQGLGDLIADRRRWTFWFIAALVIFRVELILWFVPLFLLNGFIQRTEKQKLTFNTRGLSDGVAFGVLALISSFVFDSWFWQHTTWPELSSILFNIVQNKSKHYGTQTADYYFTVVLPKLLLLYYPILTFSVPRLYTRYKSDYLKYLLPSVLFIALYSVLPHKELRFIIYTVPILNLFVAFGLQTVWISKHRAAGKFFVVLLLLGNVAISGVFFLASRFNYPGGEAMEYFHRNVNEILPNAKNIVVHADVYTSMTGFSRFGQEFMATPLYSYDTQRTLAYDKNETLQSAAEYARYNVLVMEKNKFQELKLDDGFRIVHKQVGYGNLYLVRSPLKWQIQASRYSIQLMMLAMSFDDLVVVAVRK